MGFDFSKLKKLKKDENYIEKEEKKSTTSNKSSTSTNKNIGSNSNIARMIAMSGNKIADNSLINNQLPTIRNTGLNKDSLNLNITEDDIEKYKLERSSSNSNNSKAVAKNFALGAKNTVLQIPYVIEVNSEINNPYYKQSINEMYLNSDKVSKEEKIRFMHASLRSNKRYRRKCCNT